MFKRKFHKLSKEERRSILSRMITAGTNHDGQSNRDFAANNTTFQAKCTEVGVEPTKRQASKYRNKTGKVYKSV